MRGPPFAKSGGAFGDGDAQPQPQPHRLAARSIPSDAELGLSSPSSPAASRAQSPASRAASPARYLPPRPLSPDPEAARRAAARDNMRFSRVPRAKSGRFAGADPDATQTRPPGGDAGSRPRAWLPCSCEVGRLTCVLLVVLACGLSALGTLSLLPAGRQELGAAGSWAAHRLSVAAPHVSPSEAAAAEAALLKGADAIDPQLASGERGQHGTRADGMPPPGAPTLALMACVWSVFFWHVVSASSADGGYALRMAALVVLTVRAGRRSRPSRGCGCGCAAPSLRAVRRVLLRDVPSALLTLRARARRPSVCALPTPRPFFCAWSAFPPLPSQAPLWWLSALPQDRTPSLWARGLSAVLPFALAAATRAAVTTVSAVSPKGGHWASAVQRGLGRALAGGWALWLVYALLQLATLEAAAHNVLSSLAAGGSGANSTAMYGGEAAGGFQPGVATFGSEGGREGESDGGGGSSRLIAFFLRAEASDIFYNGVALFLLALTFPSPGVSLCAQPAASSHGLRPARGQSLGRWRVEGESAVLRCAVPAWWVLLFSSANMLFLYQLGTHMLIANALLTAVTLAFALRAGVDQWVQARLAGMAMQTAIVLISGAHSVFELTLAPGAVLPAAPSVPVVAVWAKANCALVACMAIYSLLSLLLPWLGCAQPSAAPPPRRAASLLRRHGALG